MSQRRASPGLAAAVTIAALATAAGLTLANALLTLPVSFTWRHAPIAALIVICQAIVWWWMQRRPPALAAGLLRLAMTKKSLALWAGADLVWLVLLWGKGTASWSRVAPVWNWIAAYVVLRAALLALTITLRLTRGTSVPGRSRFARGARVVLLGGALAAPALAALAALAPLATASPLWLSSVAGGLLALLALALCSEASEIRDRWIGLAGVLASPALAIGGSAILLGGTTVSISGVAGVAGIAGIAAIAAPLALTSLLPALGLATMATRAALDAADPG